MSTAFDLDQELTRRFDYLNIFVYDHENPHQSLYFVQIYMFTTLKNSNTFEYYSRLHKYL